jgi:hypothetical protein
MMWGAQLRSAFTTCVTVVIADITSTVFCDPHGLRCPVLAYHSLSRTSPGAWGWAHAEPPDRDRSVKPRSMSC